MSMTDEEAAREALAGFVELDEGAVPDHVSEAFATMAAESRQALLDGRRRQEDMRPIEVVEVIPGMVIRPGDVLLLSFPTALSVEQAERIKAQVREKLPGLTDVVVMDGVTVTGVYRQEES